MRSKAFNSKEEVGSLEGLVKSVGSIVGEMGFDAQFTAESTT